MSAKGLARLLLAYSDKVKMDAILCPAALHVTVHINVTIATATTATATTAATDAGTYQLKDAGGSHKSNASGQNALHCLCRKRSAAGASDASTTTTTITGAGAGAKGNCGTARHKTDHKQSQFPAAYCTPTIEFQSTNFIFNNCGTWYTTQQQQH
ncbi:hypothetical protein Pelo_8322 [Pelomyxa schiedti]|nr:hypothetical protein Pelo_8322 [Pelomyxa schiedti]